RVLVLCLAHCLAASARSLRTVRMRAISRRASLSRVVFSSAPVAAWKRRLKSSWRRSWSAASSWSSVMSRRSLAFKEIRLPPHDLRLHGELVAGEAERLACERLGDAGQLEHHAARLDHGHPRLGRALALSHARLGRLLRHGLVREDVDPDLAAALDLACHRDTSRFDLAVREPRDAGRLQAVVAELHRVLAFRHPTSAAALVLAELRFLGKKHGLPTPCPRSWSARRRAASAPEPHRSREHPAAASCPEPRRPARASSRPAARSGAARGLRPKRRPRRSADARRFHCRARFGRAPRR